MKRILFLSMCMVVSVFSGVSIANADTVVEEKPSIVNTVDAKMDEIDRKYKVGEMLSKEDAEFVKEHANGRSGGIGILKTNHFKRSGGISGLRVSLRGSVTANHYLATNTWGVNYTAKKTSGAKKLKKIYMYGKHTAYGIIGSGGIGKVYSNTLDVTCKRSSCKNAQTDKYSASVAYAHTTANAKFYYSGGSFNLTAP
ncbi:hypothetical protein [Melghirimyces algeriensis]|uniref:Uncharacterized protein n=1 Tax=Melghirimyces algeriensis TaxID=910412 RepID=A0A521ERP5_9BACL|nr:hypothetical protein [Melghirimyces algeriensis]SMO86562.1 hypothetical protein SAMN06264849_11081 [Melghirimyces algeriensis]